jgi:phosphoribosylformylglycinamidine synthase PurS subunit
MTLRRDRRQQETTVTHKTIRATVLVRLKREVLDPQGNAVERSLRAMGFPGVRDVRIGKLIELEIEPDTDGEADLRSRLGRMADELLANPVIEDYEISVSP